MTLPVIFLPAAEDDLQTAIHNYDRRAAGLGELFQLQVNRTVAIIQRCPDGYESLHAELRRAVLRRFPYVVIYRPIADYVRIVGLLPRSKMDHLLHYESRDGIQSEIAAEFFAKITKQCGD